MEEKKLLRYQSGEHFYRGLTMTVVGTLPSRCFGQVGKENLDKYLLPFEIYADVAKWGKCPWTTQISPLLRGKAVKVYNKL